MTPPILARVAQLHGSSEDVDCDTISTATSWEYVSKSSSLSDLTRFGAAFTSSSVTNNHHINRHDLSQSSVFSSSHKQSNHHNGRGFLPHGIVPLPLPHRHTNQNNNGFNGYRLTQKDLLQPQPQLSFEISQGTNPTSEAKATSVHKDDSNLVMRSTSFNLDYGAARKYTNRFRQIPSAIPSAQAHERKEQQNLNKPRQKAFVFVAENPENGSCDVYNVPFQSDIYSLPVDTIASVDPAAGGNKKVGRSNSICTSKVITTVTSSRITAANSTSHNPVIPSTIVTKASSNKSQHHSTNYQNQRLKSSEPTSSVIAVSSTASNTNSHTNTNGATATPPPPKRKNNLNRCKSRDDCGSHILESCNIKCSPPPMQLQKKCEEPISCKPPQRWSSLATQPSTSVPKKELCTESLSSTSTSHLMAAVVSVTNSKNLPPYHNTNVRIPLLLANDSELDSEKLENLEKSNCMSVSSVNPTGKLSNVIVARQDSVSKKHRSRSVDPCSGDKLVEHQQCYQNIKGLAGSSTPNSSHTNNLNFIDNPNDHPLPPEPIESSHKEASITQSTAADRRNPLGLSFLNLFRRNKSSGGSNTGGGGGKLQNTHNQGSRTVTMENLHSESDFKSLAPSLEDERSTVPGNNESNTNNFGINVNNNKDDTSYYFRELPPPPPGEHSDDSGSDGQISPPATSPMECRDFAASIERVKDCGWYWGPLSSEAAEELLTNEPDGSFIVRDSSDARYIFSLTFKLHGLVRHVRIEHDQGNFSFGPLTRFKAATIVDFVEKAVAHSRSGRYLFFLHRRPVLGPMQVQLLHPYSRFMHPRSLKHMCRFVILKFVRRDLIHTLPLPKPLQDYLNTPHYYFEPPDGINGSNSTSCIGISRESFTTNSSHTRNGGSNHHLHSNPATNARMV